MNQNIFTSRTMRSHQEGKKQIGSLRVEQILYDKTPDPFSSRRDGSWMGLSENGAMATPVSDLFSPLEQKSESLIVRFIIRNPWQTHLACKLGNIFFFLWSCLWKSNLAFNKFSKWYEASQNMKTDCRLLGKAAWHWWRCPNSWDRSGYSSQPCFWEVVLHDLLTSLSFCQLFNGTTKAYSQGDCNSTDIYIYA